MKKTLLFALSLTFVFYSCGSGSEGEDQVSKNDVEATPDKEEATEEVTEETAEPELFYPEDKDDYSVDEALTQIRLAEDMAKNGHSEADRAKGKRAKGKWVEYLAPFPEKVEHPEDITVLSIHAEDDLRGSIQSNTLIVLTSDNYTLGDDDDYGGVTGRGVENLAIVGKDKKVKVNFEMPTEPVFYMHESRNLYFSHIHAGHTQEVEWVCEDGGFVFEFSSSQNARIDNCELFGCGVVGVRAGYSENIVCTNSRIYDCKSNAVEAYHSRGLVFRDCEITDNPTDYHLITAYDGSQIEFHNTRFTHNHFRKGESWSETAFLIFPSYDSNIGLVKCSFSDNDYDSDELNDALYRKGTGVVKSTESEI